MRFQRRTLIGGALAAALVVIGVALFIQISTKRISAGGLSFDVPFGWTVHTDLPPTTGMGQTFALVGTLPWGDCGAIDINCHYQERLSEHEIQVEFSIGILPGNDFCAFAKERPDLEGRGDGVRVAETHYLRIDGRPAVETTYSLANPDYYGSDAWRQWDIAPADTTTTRYQVFAEWRGPGEEDLLSALDRMVTSIDLGASGYGSGPADCGDPFPGLIPATT